MSIALLGHELCCVVMHSIACQPCISLPSPHCFYSPLLPCALCCRLLTALLMTLAPQSVEGREAGLVENMLVFSLVAGLTVGATAGWLWLL